MILEVRICGGVMFELDKEAIKYIELKLGAVVINLEFQPAAGG